MIIIKSNFMLLFVFSRKIFIEKFKLERDFGKFSFSVKISQISFSFFLANCLLWRSRFLNEMIIQWNGRAWVWVRLICSFGRCEMKEGERERVGGEDVYYISSKERKLQTVFWNCNIHLKTFCCCFYWKRRPGRELRTRKNVA